MEDTLDIEEQRFVSIELAGRTLCGLDASGEVRCWRDEEQLPLHGMGCEPGGTFVELASDSPLSRHACALREDGQLVCWGDDTYGQSTVPVNDYRMAALGDAVTCGINRLGHSNCWGIVAYGLGLYAYVPSPQGTFLDVAVGYFSACWLDLEGKAICWDAPTWDPLYTPLIFRVPEDSFVAIEATLHAYCGLTPEGRALCWGDEDLRLRTPTDEFIQLDGGAFHMCGLRKDHTILCWDDGYNSDTPYLDAPPGEFAQVTSNWSNSCALDFEGRWQCWGLEW